MNSRVVKKSKESILVLERKLYTKEHTLQLDTNLCVGCGICTDVCPKNAITQIPASVVSGKLVKKPTIDFETDKCIMCGICAVLCPLNAITSTINGEPVAQLVKQDAFPLLLKDITILKEKCSPECKLVCQDSCPTKAIKVVTGKKDGDGLIRILDVQVDKQLCVHCKRCEVACPLDAIHVQKPFEGTIKVIQDLCAKSCRACIDICPSRVIERSKEGKLILLDQFCFYCSACERVCPTKAIKVRRDVVIHSDKRSGIWLTALKKLTSNEGVFKELTINSQKKRNSILLETVKS